MGSIKIFEQSFGYKIYPTALEGNCCNNCAWLGKTRFMGMLHNSCNLYHNRMSDDVVIPTPTHSVCNLHQKRR